MLEEHLEWANASYYHSSEGTVNSNMHFLPSWPLSVVVAFFCRRGHTPILPDHAGTLQCAGIVNVYRFF